MPSSFPPSRDAQLVTFTQNFSTKISGSPTTYSLTAAQATSYGTLSTAFINAYTVASAKATRSPMNITLKDQAKAAMIANLRMLARIVQNAPTTTNAMRDDLGLPQRDVTPGPVPAPGMPYKFTVTLASTGAITLNWKCNNPRGSSGTIYQIYRRIGQTGTPLALGMSGMKKFVDNTLPAGTATAIYQIQAMRSTGAGEWASFTVNFGTETSTMSIEETPAKQAA